VFSFGFIVRFHMLHLGRFCSPTRICQKTEPELQLWFLLSRHWLLPFPLASVGGCAFPLCFLPSVSLPLLQQPDVQQFVSLDPQLSPSLQQQLLLPPPSLQ
jgi:hypothetical protein